MGLVKLTEPLVVKIAVRAVAFFESRANEYVFSTWRTLTYSESSKRVSAWAEAEHASKKAGNRVENFMLRGRFERLGLNEGDTMEQNPLKWWLCRHTCHIYMSVRF